MKYNITTHILTHDDGTLAAALSKSLSPETGYRWADLLSHPEPPADWEDQEKELNAALDEAEIRATKAEDKETWLLERVEELEDKLDEATDGLEDARKELDRANDKLETLRHCAHGCTDGNCPHDRRYRELEGGAA